MTPASLAAKRILAARRVIVFVCSFWVHHSRFLRDAVLVGVDFGPDLSVAGLLATILCRFALPLGDQSTSFWKFLKLGAVAMPPSPAGALLVPHRSFSGVDFFVIFEHCDKLLDAAGARLRLFCGLDAPEDGVAIHTVEGLKKFLSNAVAF